MVRTGLPRHYQTKVGAATLRARTVRDDGSVPKQSFGRPDDCPNPKRAEPGDSSLSFNHPDEPRRSSLVAAQQATHGVSHSLPATSTEWNVHSPSVRDRYSPRQWSWRRVVATFSTKAAY